MTDTTKKLMTLEQVLDLIIQAANGESKISRAGCRELADAINAHITAQREDVFENTYHGVLLSKMVNMLRNNEWAELFTGEQVIADLQAEIARLVAAQRAAVTVTEDDLIAMGRVIAERAGEDWDAIGDFAQQTIIETQRAAIDAVLKGK